MASVYARFNVLWFKYRDASGAIVREKSSYHVGEEDKANAAAGLIEAQMVATRKGIVQPPESTPTSGTASAASVRSSCPTVREYGATWVKRREARKVTKVGTERSRLKLYVYPRIGDMRLDAVRPRHLRELIDGLTKAGKLAPRTIRHLWTAIRGVFKSAVVDEYITATPCFLENGVLPPNVDADPEWRATAIYLLDEVEKLIAHPQIEERRRVLHALEGAAGLRHGEGARLRWRDYARDVKPLGRLSLDERTKKRIPRQIPVHPTLKAILAEWRLGGWERCYGRAPTPDDLIVPTLTGGPQDPVNALGELHEDLEALGLRKRRAHDLRRFFITKAQEDGADRSVLRSITHGSRKDMTDLYTEFSWEVKCREVAKLKLTLRKFDPSEAQVWAQVGHRSESTRKRWLPSGRKGGGKLEPATRFELVTCGLRNGPSLRDVVRDSAQPTEISTVAPSADEASHNVWAQVGHRLARRLMVLDSAIRAHDEPRALEVLDDIRADLGLQVQDEEHEHRELPAAKRRDE